MAIPAAIRTKARTAKMAREESEEIGLESRTVKRALVGVGREAKKKVFIADRCLKNDETSPMDETPSCQ